jgi:hypothetical protein
MKTRVSSQTPETAQAANVQAVPASRLGGEAAFADSSPVMLAQRKLSDLVNGRSPMLQMKALMEGVADSPRMAAQRKLSDMVNRSSPMLQMKALMEGVAESPRMVAQRKQAVRGTAQATAKSNNTGLPDQLKSGVETLSGMSMDHVKVHYNSERPAQLNALAYAQGSDIHVAPGQERHVPHEAWHVVQQAQGRVRPTVQMKGEVAVNDDVTLEREADSMGLAAQNVGQHIAQRAEAPPDNAIAAPVFSPAGKVVQGEFKDSAEVRKEKFIAKAAQFGIEQGDAAALYGKSGGDDPDPVTGLRTAIDKEDTRTLARGYAAKGATGEHNDVVYYANIKFYNLAGLNAAKGHAGADRIFGLMAKYVDDALETLRDEYKVQGYRHEGSRFGFMIVGDKGTLNKGVIDGELEKAKTKWSDDKEELEIADIANPKRPEQRGVDLGFTVVEIEANRGGRQEEAVNENDGAQGPADAGTAPKVTRTSQGAAPGIFKGQAEARTETFYESANTLRLNKGQADELYKIAGRSEKEALTGFDAAGDRLGTLDKAMRLYHAQWPDWFAGYVEVDVRNLGGLNDNLTRGDSDNVFKFMSDTTDKHMRSLKADVVSFRHGGDEFSFVTVGETGVVELDDVRAVLADAEIAVGAYVQNKKIWQKKKKDFTVDAVTGAELTLLNFHVLPTVFEKPFAEKAIMRSKPVIETNTEDKLWRVYGSETYWLISNEGGKFSVTNIPLQLTLNQILHSKDSAEKPRLPGTGIVWGASPVRKKDESPVDAIARADQEVEQKKK